MNKEKRIEILRRLRAANPHPTTELNFSSPFELLIAVILSAQATDKGVNKATDKLFPIANTPQAILALGVDGLKEYIKTIGLFNSKAENIIKTCRDLIEKHHGEVPEDREALEALAGVGRKTANVIQSVVFNKAAMAVDTHVFRVSHRIGLVPDSCTTPFSVEKELVKNIPEKLIPIAHHWLILHGRYVCQARTPKCDTCGLQMMCKYFCNTYKVTKEEPKAKNK